MKLTPTQRDMILISLAEKNGIDIGLELETVKRGRSAAVEKNRMYGKPFETGMQIIDEFRGNWPLDNISYRQLCAFIEVSANFLEKSRVPVGLSTVTASTRWTKPDFILCWRHFCQKRGW